ncbi:hypothetical protein DFH29DRAFT_906915 [Suillus ampliporus]|nr:hypothetical protein DFH29DRAFT_906915 [Suillus ampliporus]
MGFFSRPSSSAIELTFSNSYDTELPFGRVGILIGGSAAERTLKTNYTSNLFLELFQIQRPLTTSESQTEWQDQRGPKFEALRLSLLPTPRLGRPIQQTIAQGYKNEPRWCFSSSDRPDFLPPYKLVMMSSKARALLEPTRLHWFPVGGDFTFWPFSKTEDDAASLSVDSNCIMPSLRFLVGSLSCDIAHERSFLFYALLSTLVHCAGCVINDMLDRDFDRKREPERSKKRPIASGAVTGTEVLVLLAVLVAVIFYMFSTAGTTTIRLGEGICPVLSLFDLTFFACLLWAGYLNGQHFPFYVLGSFDHHDPRDSWKTFKASRHGAAMVCVGLVVDHHFKLASLAGRTFNA